MIMLGESIRSYWVKVQQKKNKQFLRNNDCTIKSFISPEALIPRHNLVSARFKSYSFGFIYVLSHVMRKTSFCIYVKVKAQITFAVTEMLIISFVFATRIVQFLYFLNLNFRASSHLLCLYSSVCVGPVRKPHCWFSHDAALLSIFNS